LELEGLKLHGLDAEEIDSPWLDAQTVSQSSLGLRFAKEQFDRLVKPVIDKTEDAHYHSERRQDSCV